MPLAVMAFAGAIFFLACAKRTGGPEYTATGRLDSTVEDIAGIGGKGAWISHDGLSFKTPNGRTVEAVSMKTPFKVSTSALLSGLSVGDHLTFTYRPLGRERFPFELLSAKRKPSQ